MKHDEGLPFYRFDERIPVYVYRSKYAPEMRYTSVISLMEDIHFKIFLEVGRFKESPRNFPERTCVLSRKYFKKLKKILGDNAMEVEQFDEMLCDLTILTDGERLFSLSDSPDIPVVTELPIEFSKLVYDEFGFATVVFDPLSTVRERTWLMPKDLENMIWIHKHYPPNNLFKKAVLRHYGKKEVSLPELIKNNEDFITDLVKKHDTMHANIALDRYTVYNVRIPNILFPVELLNPQNSLHREALAVHKLAKYGVEFLVLYSKPAEVTDYHFKNILTSTTRLSEVISILPEEIQIRALTLL